MSAACKRSRSRHRQEQITLRHKCLSNYSGHVQGPVGFNPFPVSFPSGAHFQSPVSTTLIGGGHRGTRNFDLETAQESGHNFQTDSGNVPFAGYREPGITPSPAAYLENEPSSNRFITEAIEQGVPTMVASKNPRIVKEFVPQRANTGNTGPHFRTV